MRIGIDHRPALYGRGGLAVYVRELVTALAAAYPGDRFELYGHRLRGRIQDDVPSVPRNAKLRRLRVPNQALAVAARFGLGADRLLGGVDVMHLTDFAPLSTSRAPSVATLHDVLFEDLPECYPADTRARLASATRRIVARAQRLVVPSFASRDALTRHFGVDEAAIDLVPLAPRTFPDVPPADEHGSYVLFVGTLQPRKNLLRLFEAFDLVHAEHAALRLVVAGSRGWLDEAILAGMAERAHVVYEGMVTLDRLAALYRGARALALPSLAEGFGLPVVEAMTHGVPVLVGAGTACAEVAGAGGIAVDATDVEALQAGLLRLVANDEAHARFAVAARERARSYSWLQTARGTHASYERAVGG